jgi:hypothetical protein
MKNSGKRTFSGEKAGSSKSPLSALLGSHPEGYAADPVDSNDGIEKFLTDEFFDVDELFGNFGNSAVKRFTVIGSDGSTLADVLYQNILDGGEIVEGSLGILRQCSPREQGKAQGKDDTDKGFLDTHCQPPGGFYQKARYVGESGERRRFTVTPRENTINNLRSFSKSLKIKHMPHLFGHPHTSLFFW